MKSRRILISVSTAISFAVVSGIAISATQDKYTVKVTNGLAFADFKGYEGWQVIGLSQHGDVMAAILGNPEIIQAYQMGIPENGKPFPDGAKMAKIHWSTRKNDVAPGQPTVTGTLHDVDFMVKDSKRFTASNGWGYAQFEYDPSTNAFRPGTLEDKPPQGNDAKCGAACHTVAKNRDYVFTEYAAR